LRTTPCDSDEVSVGKNSILVTGSLELRSIAMRKRWHVWQASGFKFASWNAPVGTRCVKSYL